MTSKRTRRFLYAFILSQPLVLLLLVLDQGFGMINVPRRIIHLAVALPWSVGALATTATLRELGLSVGREWAQWVLALALLYGVQFYASQEIYSNYIVPVNLIAFPLLTIILSHLDLRDTF